MIAAKNEEDMLKSILKILERHTFSSEISSNFYHQAFKETKSIFRSFEFLESFCFQNDILIEPEVSPKKRKRCLKLSSYNQNSESLLSIKERISRLQSNSFLSKDPGEEKKKKEKSVYFQESS